MYSIFQQLVKFGSNEMNLQKMENELKLSVISDTLMKFSLHNSIISNEEII